MLTLGTDNGSAFCGRAFKAILGGLGIAHRRGGYRDPESQAFIDHNHPTELHCQGTSLGTTGFDVVGRGGGCESRFRVAWLNTRKKNKCEVT